MVTTPDGTGPDRGEDWNSLICGGAGQLVSVTVLTVGGTADDGAETPGDVIIAAMSALPPLGAMVSPSTARNCGPILEVLKPRLPPRGVVLEIAAGAGEHAVYNAAALPGIQWQPTDPAPEALASIAAWRNQAGLSEQRAFVHHIAPLRQKKWVVLRQSAIARRFRGQEGYGEARPSQQINLRPKDGGKQKKGVTPVKNWGVTRLALAHRIFQETRNEMDEIPNTIPEVDDGNGTPEGSQESAWAAFCNWARQPASRGFAVGAALVAAALVLGRSSGRPPILY